MPPPQKSTRGTTTPEYATPEVRRSLGVDTTQAVSASGLPQPSKERLPDALLRERIQNEIFGTRTHVTHIGKYTLLGVLGEGGMGLVCSAYDTSLDRKVAIKLIHSRSGSLPAVRKRMMREAQAMARLSHPNVVQVYEIGEHGRELFVAMEFVDGEDLSHWLQRGEHTWRDVINVFVSAGEGLTAAHEAGLVHRDFKPANIFIGHDTRVRVGDFGLARLLETSRGSKPPPTIPPAAAVGYELSQSLTAPGALIGTPRYMAPEQFLQPGAGDEQSDQFSFCVSLFEALYGIPPFSGDTLASLSSAIVSSAPAQPPEGSPVPHRVYLAICRGLHKEPSQRWPTIGCLVEVLSYDPRARLRELRRLFLLAFSLVGLSSFLGWLAVDARTRAVEENNAKVTAEMARNNAIHALRDERNTAQTKRARLLQQRASEKYALGDPLAALAPALESYIIDPEDDAARVALRDSLVYVRALREGGEMSGNCIGEGSGLPPVTNLPEHDHVIVRTESSSAGPKITISTMADGTSDKRSLQLLACPYFSSIAHPSEFTVSNERVLTADSQLLRIPPAGLLGLGDDGTMRTWREDGQCVAAHHTHTTPVTLVLSNEDATKLVTASRDGRVVLWNVDRSPGWPLLRLEDTLVLPIRAPTTICADDTLHSVSFSNGTSSVVWTPEASKQVRGSVLPADRIVVQADMNTSSCSQDCRMFSSVGGGSPQWSTRDFRPYRVDAFYEVLPLYSLRRLLIFGGTDIGEYEVEKKRTSHVSFVSVLDWTNDSVEYINPLPVGAWGVHQADTPSLAVLVGGLRRVRILELPSLSTLFEVSGGIDRATLLPGLPFVVLQRTTEQDTQPTPGSRVELWNYRTGILENTIETSISGRVPIGSIPAGGGVYGEDAWFAADSRMGGSEIWTVFRDGTVKRSVSIEETVRSASLSEAGDIIAVVSTRGSLGLYSLESGAEIYRFSELGHVTAAHIGSRYLTALDIDGRLSLIDLRNNSLISSRNLDTGGQWLTLSMGDNGRDVLIGDRQSLFRTSFAIEERPTDAIVREIDDRLGSLVSLPASLSEMDAAHTATGARMRL